MLLRAVNKALLPLGTWRRSFFVTLFFVMVASSLFWLESYRFYEAEIRVLVIGKSPGIATDQVVENLAEMIGNLSFYERVLVENDLVEDSFEGYSKDKRRALWNEVVTAKRSDGSDVLTVTTSQDTSEQSKIFAEATVRTLFSVAGFYYNIKTDIDLRVVDAVIVKTVLRSPFQYILVSFGSALGVTVFFFWLLSVVPLFFRERRVRSPVMAVSKEENISAREKSYQEYAIGTTVPYIDPQKFIPARPTLTFGLSHGEQQIREEILQSEATEVRDSSVNITSERMLPGMDVEALPFEFEETFEDKQKKASLLSSPTPESFSDGVTPTVTLGEPTIEEYKRRLNELLRGGK